MEPTSSKLTILLPAAGILVAGVALFAWATTLQVPTATSPQSSPLGSTAPAIAADNVYMEGNIQVVEITAKGGYSPGLSTAKANVPTVLRIFTSKTMDCSIVLSVPAIGHQARLPFSGMTDIALPAQTAGTTITALCWMGMYSFDVRFSA